MSTIISISFTAAICILIYWFLRIIASRIRAQNNTAHQLNMVQAVQEAGYGGRDELVLPINMLFHPVANDDDNGEAVQLSVEETGHGTTSEMV